MMSIPTDLSRFVTTIVAPTAASGKACPQTTLNQQNTAQSQSRRADISDVRRTSLRQTRDMLVDEFTPHPFA
jgi:hypothetical protein